MTRPPTRVVLADDHTLVRSGIRRILESQPGFEVVGEAADGAEAVALVRSTAPDVVVLDLNMPGTGGLDVLPAIKAEPIKNCPTCGKKAAERVIGPGAAVIFKGSGFYQTDYRSESYKKAAEADKPSSTSKSESSSTSNSSAPAEKKSSSKAKG